MPDLHPIHSHVCSSCGDVIWCCACPDKRQNNRETGKARKILCLSCHDLEAQLKAFFGQEVIELSGVN